MATAEEVKRLLDETRKNTKKSEKPEWVKPPSEANKKFKFRIVPYTPKGDFTVIKWYHWGIGEHFRTECKGAECPICEVINNYINEDKSQRKERFKRASKYMRKGQAFFNVQIPSIPDRLYLLSLSESFLDWLIENITDEDIGIPDLLDTRTGRDIIIWRKTDKGAFERQVSPRPRPIAETDEEIQALLEKVVDLDSYLSGNQDDDLTLEMVAKELEEKLSGIVIDVEEDTAIDNVTEEEVQEETNTINKECFGQFKIENNECLMCEYAVECNEKTKK